MPCPEPCPGIGRDQLIRGCADCQAFSEEVPASEAAREASKEVQIASKLHDIEKRVRKNLLYVPFSQKHASGDGGNHSSGAVDSEVSARGVAFHIFHNIAEDRCSRLHVPCFHRAGQASAGKAPAVWNVARAGL